MLWVILRTGKVLQYNDANNLDVVGDQYEIVKKFDTGVKHWRACIPAEVIERVEWQKPCRILEEKTTRKRERY